MIPLKSCLLSLFLSLLSLSFVSSATPNTCGSHGPTQWLNAHISDQAIATIGSPFSTRYSSSPNFFDFYGSTHLQGLHGCFFSSLSETFNEDSSSGSSSGYNWLATTTYTQKKFIKTLRASDESLDVEYKDCTPSGGDEKRLVVKSYRHTSPSFPNGLQVKFYYDAFCRVHSLEEHQPESSEESAQWVLTYSSNFTYASNSAIHPSQIKSTSANAITLVNNEFQFNSNGLITVLTATHRTAPLDSEVSIAAPITEAWDFSYDPQTSTTLEHAHAHRETLREDVDEFFHFHYDRSGRWSTVSYSTRRGDDNDVESPTITTMRTAYRERTVDLFMNFGSTTRLRGIKGTQ